MHLNVPPPPKRREVDAALTHGGAILAIGVETKRGTVETTYLVEHPAPGHVRLVTEDGEVYDVTAFGCTCADHQHRGKDVVCKHRVACEDVGLLPSAAPESEPSAPPPTT